MAILPLRTRSRVAILGAGPVGLEAALLVQSLGHDFTVYERSAVAAHVKSWGFVKMFSPFGKNVTPQGRTAILREHPKHEFPAESDIITGADFRESYLIPLSETPDVKEHLRLGTRVMALGRAGMRKGDLIDPKRGLSPFRILVRDGEGQERFESADIVLDCTGAFTTPNYLGDGGIPAAGEIPAAEAIAYRPEDILGARRDHYAGKSILVVGSGFTAAQTVVDLVTLAEEHQSTWIIWLTDGRRDQPLARMVNDPLRERDRLAAAANRLAMRCDGNLEYRPMARIEEVSRRKDADLFHVVAQVNGKRLEWEVERVIAAVGHKAVAPYQLEVAEDDPSFHVLGARRGGEYLLSQGVETLRSTLQRLLACHSTPSRRAA